MSAHRFQTIHSDCRHLGWDRSLSPVRTMAPGEVVTFEVVDASNGQIVPDSSIEDVRRYEVARGNPLTGPVLVEGAARGDALKITLLEFAPSGWGWTAIFPGFGLLADQFPEPALQLWDYDADGLQPALFGPHARVPIRPFVGTIGVAPAEPGRHDAIPPRRVGGNMDIRDLVAGTELHLPIEVPGALFSIGDTHAAQGDGEVCGTAIESPMTVALRIDLIRDARLAFPRFTTPGPVSRPIDERGYDVTTGVGPDLMEGARAAVSGMIDLLCRRHRLRPEDAYMLCSVCGDLRISEVVDAPNWVVSFYFPRRVFA